MHRCVRQQQSRSVAIARNRLDDQIDATTPIFPFSHHEVSEAALHRFRHRGIGRRRVVSQASADAAVNNDGESRAQTQSPISQKWVARNTLASPCPVDRADIVAARFDASSAQAQSRHAKVIGIRKSIVHSTKRQTSLLSATVGVEIAISIGCDRSMLLARATLSLRHGSHRARVSAFFVNVDMLVAQHTPDAGFRESAIFSSFRQSRPDANIIRIKAIKITAYRHRASSSQCR